MKGSVNSKIRAKELLSVWAEDCSKLVTKIPRNSRVYSKKKVTLQIEHFGEGVTGCLTILPEQMSPADIPPL